MFKLESNFSDFRLLIKLYNVIVYDLFVFRCIMSLFKFYKKKEGNEQKQEKFMKIDLNSLPVDPAERKPIEFYHVNQIDEIRRAYLQKGPFQPQCDEFPIRDFGGKPRKFQKAWLVDNKI